MFGSPVHFVGIRTAAVAADNRAFRDAAGQQLTSRCVFWSLHSRRSVVPAASLIGGDDWRCAQSAYAQVDGTRPWFADESLFLGRRARERWLSADANLSAHGIDQTVRVVASAIFENDLDILDVRDARRRVAFDQHEIRTLTRCECPDVLLPTEEVRAVLRGYMNRFNGTKTRFDQEFYLPLIAVPWQNPAIPSRVRPREQQPAGGDEGTFELHLLAK